MNLATLTGSLAAWTVLLPTGSGCFGRTKSLEWAMAVPGGVVQAVPYYVLILVVASAVTRVLTTRGSIRALLTNRTGTLLALTWVAVVASVNTVVSGQDSINPVQQFFAGACGDTVSYVAVAAVPLGFVTGYLARLSEAAEGWRDH